MWIFLIFAFNNVYVFLKEKAVSSLVDSVNQVT